MKLRKIARHLADARGCPTIQTDCTDCKANGRFCSKGMSFTEARNSALRWLSSHPKKKGSYRAYNKFCQNLFQLLLPEYKWIFMMPDGHLGYAKEEPFLIGQHYYAYRDGETPSYFPRPFKLPEMPPILESLVERKET